MSKAEKAISTSACPSLARGAFVFSGALLPPAMHFDVSTALGLLETLGGAANAADQYDLSADAINRWAVTGNIPTGWHLRLFADVWGRGKTTDPRIWGFESTDPAFQSLASLQWLARQNAMGGANA